MSRQRVEGHPSDPRGGSSLASDEALRTTQLVQQLARNILFERDRRRDPDVDPSEAQIHRAMRLCIRILTSHIGEPLLVDDEASIAQLIRAKLVKNPSPKDSGVEDALRFEDLHRRLKLLAGLKNRGPMLHLLHALSDTGAAASGTRRQGIAQIPSQIFTEPSAGLSDIGHVRKEGGRGLAGSGDSGGRSSEGHLLEDGTRWQGESTGARDRHAAGKGRSIARRTTEVSERTLLRGILYAFQGIDSQYIKYCEEESGYVLDPRLRLGLKQRAMVTEMLEMGWLFTVVVRYNQSVDAGSAGLGPGRVQQAFVFSLKEDMTEYYRLIAVLGAQLNLESCEGGGASAGGTEGLTLQRLFVWVMDPLKRLTVMATLVAAAAQLKGGALASCLHSHVDHGDPLVRSLVQRTMVRACESLFYMIKLWMFEGELVDHHNEFFVQESKVENDTRSEETLWHDRYFLDLCLLPKFIDEELALQILTIGKAINFLRRLCGESQWIMGPMAKATAQTAALEYGNTASLRAAVESCSTLTNARLVNLMFGRYRLKAHLRVLKKFLLHGQGDLMLSLMEVLGPELDKNATVIYRHNVMALVEGVIKTINISPDEAQEVAKIGVKVMGGGESETGWDVFSLEYHVDAPVSTIVSIELEQALPELKGALHRCSLIRGQMFFLTTNLSNYMMFEVLETSWGTLQDKLDSAATMDDIIEAHRTYMEGILARAMLDGDNSEIARKIEQVLGVIIDFCRHQESLVIRAMAEVATRTAEEAEKERRTARGQWGTEGGAGRGGRRLGRDPYGMGNIEEIARRYEETLSELVGMLERKCGKMEILRFLIFRLDFNDYYKERRAAPALPPPPPPSQRHGQGHGQGHGGGVGSARSSQASSRIKHQR